MNDDAPEIGIVRTVAEKYLDGITGVEHVKKGWSTYVFRVRAASGTFYVRFLPEDASFAAEVLAHNILLEKGVLVPRVVDFEHRNETTVLSVMITEEIPGVSVEDEWPADNSGVILREAGCQIARMHKVPVDGFGWIDRSFYDRLKGENPTFQDFFNGFVPENLKMLELYEFTDDERTSIAALEKTARRILDVQHAVLTHGDFDVSHIFHSEGRYTGLIDLGEIRGNNRLFDLATCALFDNSPDRTAYSHVLEGYREITPLTDNDIYAIELMALFRTIPALARKATRPALAGYFFRLAKRQLNRINDIYT